MRPLLALTAACGSGDDAPAPTPTGTSAEPAPSPATTGPAGPLTGVWDKADPEAPATLTVSDDGAVTLTAEDATCNGEAQRAAAPRTPPPSPAPRAPTAPSP